MNRFVVDLGKVKLNKEEHAMINTNIQKAVLQTLADIKIDGDYVIRFPIDWPGMFGGPFLDDIRELGEINKEIIEFTNR